MMPSTSDAPAAPLENDFSSPVSVAGSEPTLETTNVGEKSSLSAASLQQRRVGRDRERHDDVRAGGLELGDLRPDVRVARLVGLARDDLRLGDVAVQALGAVAAEVVVLAEVRDLLALELLGDVLAEDRALRGVVGLPAERVRVLVGLVPAHAARGDEQVGHPRRVQVVGHLRVGRRAEAADHREDLVLQHELLGHLDRVGRVVAVVAGMNFSLRPLIPPSALTYWKYALMATRDLAVARRGRAGEREVPADRDLGLADARRGARPPLRASPPPPQRRQPAAAAMVAAAGGPAPRPHARGPLLGGSLQVQEGAQPRHPPWMPPGAASMTPISTTP